MITALALTNFLRGGFAALGIMSAVPAHAGEQSPGSGPIPPQQQRCRIGFDVGSSGIRGGSSVSAVTARVNIDYLADVWQDNRMDATLDQTVAALTELRRNVDPTGDCAPVAGSFSAWRLALEKGGAAHVADVLQDIHQRTSIPFFIIPQDVEGIYGHFAAQFLLGDRLKTDAVVDIGGGSMQVSGAHAGWGAALGQQAWLKVFCEEIRHAPACVVNPMGAGAAKAAHDLAVRKVSGLRKAMGSQSALTAVSRPVVHSMYPVLSYLFKTGAIGGMVGDAYFDKTALESAILALSSKDDSMILDSLNRCMDGGKEFCSAKFINTLVTDMVFLNAIMDELKTKNIYIADAGINNVPGIIADVRGYAWANSYPCYLSRLKILGISAYTSDPSTCPSAKP